MQLTHEQQLIINSTGNIKINAVAGSGKTTTIVEYAKSRPKNSKILYMAFNKSVKLEARKKFESQGLKNVKVETAHSLAYKHIIFRYRYKVRLQGYKINEIAELLKIKGNEEKHTEYIVANHISKFITYYCNSDKQSIQDLNYLDIVTDHNAKTFVRINYKYIESQTIQFLSKMNKGEIEITHDFYIKKFQLSNPNLNYDYILFDEGQDASAAMLDIFLKQKATKVIVGDTHQQIYSWRYAINALEKVDFKTFNLSTSFRFGQDIANLAMQILQFKKQIENQNLISIAGKGNNSVPIAIGIKTKATIARTNLGLLLKAIEYVKEKQNVKQIYFEGNINSYTYADDGASLYDVLHLSNGKHFLIKDQLIRSMKNLIELEEYIDKTEDAQLGMMLEIVKEYGNEIPSIIKAIKDKHVKNDDKENAEMIFSTVHRCKGMEYDTIQLANDFISQKKLEKLKSNSQMGENSISKLNEEINLLYVAITRTKNSLHIPEILVPTELNSSAHIHILKELKEELIETSEIESSEQIIATEQIEKNESSPACEIIEKEKAYSVAAFREKHKDAYKPWTIEFDEELTKMYCEGINVKDLSKHFGRTKGAIYSRIKKLELEEIYG
ncbi:MAG TPA: UvrD-helicase domain-containing protein [Bacteroidia bacterium]|nr:UvrD-helicase domain-containing protein [Bacteroidia bacterium]